MRRLTTIICSTTLALGFAAGCGKEVGRIPFTGEGLGSGSMSLKAGEVSFWTDIDLSYEGDAALAYHIELSQGGSKVATAMCNPLGPLPVKTGWVESNIGASHSRRGMGKMSCSTTLTAGGPTAISAKLAFSKPPAKVALKQADLVIKQ